MADFLLELLTEEIPARMQTKARDDLARLFAAEIGKAGLKAEAIETFSTPRRLALIARDLPPETEATSEELKGPRTSAPPQALEGFLRKTGLQPDQLTDRDGVYFAVLEKPGRATASVLAEAVPAIVRAFPWPKSMRWGAASISTESLRWVRPLQGIVALLGEELIEIEIDGIEAGAATVGHRFHHPGRITIGSAEDYAAKLRACHVIVDHAERAAMIGEGAATAAAQAGLTLVDDPVLLAENAGLTEWPVPLLGSFDPAFLALPPEVIQLTMATNQKYFACRDAAGELAPAFVCTANVEPRDLGRTIVAGNQKVLAARLADATFFWEQDLKVPLEEQARKLDQIVFHEKLGTVADKVDRVAKLARWLIEQNIVTSSTPAKAGAQGGAVQGDSGLLLSQENFAEMAETAARLCKADLVTGMVGEFPELQGVMGGYYARAQGLPDPVADAIRDHYKPVGQGDDVPTAPVTVAVSLADKLDTLRGFFGVDEKPTGSRDPFALRRAALGVIQLLTANELRLPIGEGELLDFFADRLKVQQREAGVRHDLIDAVFALGGEDDLVRLLARVKALQAFVETAEGRDLLAGYKRAANILKKEGWAGSSPAKAGTQGEAVQGDSGLLLSQEHGEVQGIPQTGEEDPFVMAEDLREALAPSHAPAPAEAALIAALDAAAPRARAAVAREDFEGAMAALASLRKPVDDFFEAVTVNDPDPAKRSARLDLLARMRDAVHQVADFARIEG